MKSVKTYQVKLSACVAKEKFMVFSICCVAPLADCSSSSSGVRLLFVYLGRALQRTAFVHLLISRKKRLLSRSMVYAGIEPSFFLSAFLHGP